VTAGQTGSGERDPEYHADGRSCRSAGTRSRPNDKACA
jgi:hypothetical protein